MLCYLNYINYLSWFDKRNNVVITNHENIYLFIYLFSVGALYTPDTILVMIYKTENH